MFARAPTSGVSQVRSWPLLALTLACVVAHAAGAFQGLDRQILGALVGLRAAPDRSVAPLLLAIDDDALERLGPLPWPVKTWGAVADALGAVGVAEAALVDPWPRLVAADGAPGDAGPVRLLVPLVLSDAPHGQLSGRPLPGRMGPLEPWGHQLYLPVAPDGVLRDLSERARAGGAHGPSAVCAWTPRCPTGGALGLAVRPLGDAGSLPTLSISDALDGVGLPRDSAARTVLVGVTAAPFARHVRVGPGADLMTWPEAVGHAVASARAARKVPQTGPVWSLLVVLGVIAASAGLTRFDRRVPAAAMAVGLPVVALGLCAVLFVADLLVPPVTATVVGAGLPPLVVAIASRQLAADFLRSMALLLAQDGSRYAWRSTRLEDPQHVLHTLASLSRNHTPAQRMCYLHLQRSGALSWVGGYGIERADLDSGRLRIGVEPFSSARSRNEGSRTSELFSRGAFSGRVVPIRQRGARQRGALLGFWCVAGRPDEPAPEPATLARVARWVGRHCALEVQERPSLTRWLSDRLESDGALVQDLFESASEERRRQVRALHAVGLPLLTADLAGAILFANRAGTELLARHGLANVRSLRELMFLVGGEEDLSARVHGLFVLGEPQHVRWDPGPRETWLLAAQPVRRDGGGDDVLGYVAVLEDLSESQRLREVRAAVVDMTTSRVRNATMAIMGYARLLARKVQDPALDRVVQGLLDGAGDVSQAIDELRALVEFEEGRDVEVGVDVIRVLRGSIEQVPFAERHQELRTDLPEHALPVVASPTSARAALHTLLLEAARAAPVGAELFLGVQEHADRTVVTLTWPGAGLDAETLERFRRLPPHSEGVPTALVPYCTARNALPDLTLASAAGQGVQVVFSLPRSGSP